jgi:hypothetical protein
MARLRKKSSNDQETSIFTRPWFVAVVVFSCFAVLTPKIFVPLFRQIFGLGRSEQEGHSDHMPPHLRMRYPPSAHQSASASGSAPSERPIRAAPQFGRPGPSFGPQATPTGSSSSRSLLNFLLPVYAVGIGLYMMYTLFKVFNKSKKSDEQGDGEDESDECEYDETKAKATTMRFRERNRDNFRWDANDAEFKYFNKSSSHYARGEETEDELNGYARYESLDADYVAYLKSRRRKKRQETGKYVLNTSLDSPLQAPSAASGSQPVADAEIPLTSNIGLTSITNTNVLMNETLERMKYSLNKINEQLNRLEKKNSPMDDPELESLRLQLTQTELQMGKIMTIVDDVSSTVHTQQHQESNEEKTISDEELLEQEDEEEDEQRPSTAKHQQTRHLTNKAARLRKMASSSRQVETGNLLRNRKPNNNSNNKKEQNVPVHKPQQRQRLHKKAKKTSDSSASSLSPSLSSSPALSSSLSSDVSDHEYVKEKAPSVIDAARSSDLELSKESS